MFLIKVANSSMLKVSFLAVASGGRWTRSPLSLRQEPKNSIFLFESHVVHSLSPIFIESGISAVATQEISKTSNKWKRAALICIFCRQSDGTAAPGPEKREQASRRLPCTACSDSSIRDPRTGKLVMWKAFKQYWENQGEAECNDIFTKHGGLKAAAEEAFIQALILHGNLATQDCHAPHEATLRVSFDLVLPASVSQQSGIPRPCSTCHGAK